MTYIRTKDGIYGVSVSGSVNANGTVYAKCYQYSKLIKQDKESCTIQIINFKESDVIAEADTIEELCDEFVIKHKNKKMPFICDDFQKEAILKDRAKVFTYWCEAVYGCIWTSKGLIYVAKLNGNGELELI